MESVNSQLVDLPAIQAIDGWQEFMEDGDGFLKTAVMAQKKKKKTFTPEIMYNLIAMGIEKFVMAALMRHGAMPYNHTMRDLVEAIDQTFPGDLDEIRDGLLSFDQYQDICDLNGFRITPPESEEIPAMLTLGSKMQEFARDKLSP